MAMVKKKVKVARPGTGGPAAKPKAAKKTFKSAKKRY